MIRRHDASPAEAGGPESATRDAGGDGVPGEATHALSGGQPTIREATEADVRAFYGSVNWTFRAFVAELDGQVLGIGGGYYDGPSVVAFSSLKPEMLRYKKTIVLGARKIMELVRGRSCFAIASEKHPGSERLLEHFGFERVNGRVFKWTF